MTATASAAALPLAPPRGGHASQLATLARRRFQLTTRSPRELLRTTRHRPLPDWTSPHGTMLRRNKPAPRRVP